MVIGDPVDSLQRSINFVLADAERFPKGWDVGDLEIFHFPQTWSSTTLGFPGIGGCAMCSAYTSVIFAGDAVWVFFNGWFAYYIHEPTIELIEDVSGFNVAEVGKQGRYRRK